MEFLYSFLEVAQKVGLLFIIIAIGFVCQRVRLLTEEANKCMADIVMYIVTPCVIINAFSATTYSNEALWGMLRNIGLVALIALAAHTMMIVVVCLLFRFKDDDRRRVMRFAAVFSNAGFIALPLAQALIDTPECHEGALYAAIFLAIFNIALWTWGFVNMSGDSGAMSWKKIVLNPGLIGVVFGMLLFTSPLYVTVGDSAGIRIPSILADALSALSALNLPLPMLMVGYYLGKADILAAFRDGWSYVCMAMRLIVFPMAALAILYALGVRGNVLIVSVIGAAAPVGATTTIFSAKYGRDTDLSVRLVALSTVLSLVTMPLIVGLTQMIA
ncbi:MAG: AEC family transporter [Clostridia bacterium]|nr:AEC family transporter [Clostridia bacterium]